MSDQMSGLNSKVDMVLKRVDKIEDEQIETRKELASLNGVEKMIKANEIDLSDIKETMEEIKTHTLVLKGVQGNVSVNIDKIQDDGDQDMFIKQDEVENSERPPLLIHEEVIPETELSQAINSRHPLSLNLHPQ